MTAQQMILSKLLFNSSLFSVPIVYFCFTWVKQLVGYLVCRLSWTFARSNHTAIMAISACPSLVLVQVPGVICKAAEQEMRLVCCRTCLMEPRGVPPRRERGGRQLGDGVMTELGF